VLTEAGIKAHGEVRNTIFGLSAREIVNDAIEVDADVIVMGSRGRSDLAGLLLGSTAHQVIHLSERAGLVVPFCLAVPVAPRGSLPGITRPPPMPVASLI
jgi:nucleotide-binding universal stress UspA family protein